MWVYLLIYLILILVVTVGVVLWIIVMAKGAARLDVGQTHKINDFTYWFQDQVMGMAEWSDVRKCLISKDICTSHDRNDNFFFSHNLKQGCCRPPAICNKHFLTVHDCSAWRNQSNAMCYYCSTCEEGFVSQLAVLWQRLFPGMVVLLLILITVFILGCRVFRQNKADHYKRLYETAKP
ncbi:hypothetical protein SOVF_125720 [Spinacia oleracea]|nr:hypothetical protein SOVF_125720 [Spinacia oleracea]